MSEPTPALAALADELGVSPERVRAALSAAGIEAPASAPPRPPAVPTFSAPAPRHRPPRPVVSPPRAPARVAPTRSIYARPEPSEAPAPAPQAAPAPAPAARSTLPLRPAAPLRLPQPRPLPRSATRALTTPRASAAPRPTPPRPRRRTTARLAALAGAALLTVCALALWGDDRHAKTAAPSLGAPAAQAAPAVHAAAPAPSPAATAPEPQAPRPSAAPQAPTALTGRVLADGRPLAGATVRARQGAWRAKAETDAAGAFRLTPPRGLVRLQVAHPHQANRRTVSTVVLTREPAQVELVLPRFASLRLDWSPPTPLRVRLTPLDAPAAAPLHRELPSSALLRDLPPGRYRLVAVGEAHAAAEVLELRPGLNAAELTLEQLGALDLTVTGPAGPVDDARVELRPPPRLGADHPRRRASAAGALRLPHGRWTLIVDAPGHAAARLQVAVRPGATTTAAVELRRARTARLLLARPRATAAALLGPPGARLVVTPAGLEARGLLPDEAATVLLRLPDGALARADLPRGAVDVRPRPLAPAAVRGVVCRPSGPSLGAGFRVRLEHDALSQREQSLATHAAGRELLHTTAVTDAKGAFRLEGLVPGRWTLRVQGARTTLRLRAGTTTTAVVQLR